MKKEIIKALESAIKKLGAEITIELTPAKGHGDFATNVAMKLASQLKDNPANIANRIVENLEADFIEKAEVAGPGFINIFLKGDVIGSVVEKINKEGKDFGKGNQSKFINVEYVSANPTGHLHLGHARGAAVGSTLINILRFAGNKVDAEYYINDAGNQINTLGESTFARYRELFGKPLELPEDCYRGTDILDAANHIKDKYGDKFVEANYEDVKDLFKEEARLKMLEIIKEHLSRYNVKLDLYSSELDLHNSSAIKDTLKKLDQWIYEQDGATWLRTTDYDDDKDRVVIKGDGALTYLTPDIAYHNVKLSRGYDELINIWGVDHIGYVPRMKAALEMMGLPKDKMDFLMVNLVKLMKDGQELKMSKRKGTSYTIEELIEEVGVDAARWFMLDRSINSEFIFDINLATSQSNDNPVFTVQYTHARANQLIEKSTAEPKVGEYNKKEVELINLIAKFPEIVDQIATNHKVNQLPQYLIEISREFNSWYSNNKAIGNERESQMVFLAKAVKQVLANGLELMGISAPNKM